MSAKQSTSFLPGRHEDLMRPAYGRVPVDLSGERYGRLVVVRCVGKTRRGNRVWLCRCDCGKEVAVAAGDLRRKRGPTKSCGCFIREVTSRREATHRRSKTGEYAVWSMMKQRCFNPAATGFANYGGRGITVCARWRESFEAFLADMGVRPSPSHELDRIDNDGHYEPGNVRWAMPKAQGRNRRVNKVISHDGNAMSLVEWAEFLGIPYRMLKDRLANGWTFERAISEPRRKYPARRRA
jgi:hypothetical protein